MELALVRHGESVWNRERRLQGQAMGVPLTATGREQAREAGEMLAGLGFGGAPVWSSDQLRAVQTGEVVCARLGSDLVTTPLLREQSLGRLEGRLVDELVAEPTPPGVHVTEVAWGGGESVQQVHQRCREVLPLLVAAGRPGDRLVVVGHGDALRVLLAVIEGRGHRDVDWVTIANGQVLVRQV